MLHLLVRGCPAAEFDAMARRFIGRSDLAMGDFHSHSVLAEVGRELATSAPRRRCWRCSRARPRSSGDARAAPRAARQTNLVGDGRHSCGELIGRLEQEIQANARVQGARPRHGTAPTRTNVSNRRRETAGFDRLLRQWPSSIARRHAKQPLSGCNCFLSPMLPSSATPSAERELNVLDFNDLLARPRPAGRSVHTAK